MKTTFKVVSFLLAMAGCAGDDTTVAPDGPPATLVNASDVPVDGLSADDIAKFDDGDALFGIPFRPVDGLGPLFIRTACVSCHQEGSRGPGLVQKMAVVEADGFTPAADQSLLAFGHTIRQGIAAGATIGIAPPMDAPNVKVSIRIGPPVLGRGYLEAISDAEILRVEAEQAQRADGIHGVARRVPFYSVPNVDTTYGTFVTGQTYIGRFGLKARIPALDDFTADAYQGDMGMTTPMRPSELANPDNLADDMRAGVDLDQAHIDRVTFYMRHIAIPRRVNLPETGPAVFAQAKCAVCHQPSLRTRADYPISQIADVDAPVFTELLLHRMGDALADGMTDEGADSRAWRTAPLIGLRFARTYLHDGRAGSVEEAILAHDGEAKISADAFRALSPADQQTLLQYVEAL